MRENPYPDRPPMTVMRIAAGIIADGALPKADIPAGKLSTPAPTIDLTRLKIMPVIGAPSEVEDDDALSSPSGGCTAAADEEVI